MLRERRTSQLRERTIDEERANRNPLLCSLINQFSITIQGLLFTVEGINLQSY